MCVYTKDNVSLFSCSFFSADVEVAADAVEKRLCMVFIDRITGARTHTHTHSRDARDTLIFYSTAQVRFISGKCCYINIRAILDTTNERKKNSNKNR